MLGNDSEVVTPTTTVDFPRLENWAPACVNDHSAALISSTPGFPSRWNCSCLHRSKLRCCSVLTTDPLWGQRSPRPPAPAPVCGEPPQAENNQLCKGVKQHLGRLVLVPFIGWLAQIPLKSFQQSQNGCFFSQGINWLEKPPALKGHI